MKVAVIKYNAGNIQSVVFALERLGIQSKITENFDEIREADKVIFPGVGEAGSTMKYLKDKGLDGLIKSLKQPVLGICLGQQLMCTFSEEGNTDCIGIFDVPVLRFQSKLKVPHMGWNSLFETNGLIFKDLNPQSYVYFVHSFYVPICKDTAAKCEYSLPFSAGLQKDNFFATQFHPEKSSDVGQKILKNFINI